MIAYGGGEGGLALGTFGIWQILQSEVDESCRRDETIRKRMVLGRFLVYEKRH